ncbi:hypothetical protein GSI_04427 [Ganoderma sinense ZZ0214-1]|uniref:F-box domain-containing protein n=1 Tax=Ganoderma sinense ZZ0214-1 TaxID=1077348 RepID=A0A2G8SJ60_9APHY|nr:hypothetical protein GSI_04427 [Ganoderma sinense ZZ0214-1]
MRLSIEVSEAVIDQASDNASTLRHLSLTCTEFLPRARYHLFLSIVIQTMAQMLSSRDFLDAHPWLPPVVHRVAGLLIPLREDYSKDGSKKPIHLLDVVPVHLLIRFPNLRVWTMASGSPLGLSLHRSALRCYRHYGSRIHYLHLLDACFEGMSDFAGLISAFTSIHTLACSSITFRKADENDSSQVTLRSNTLSRHPPISTLRCWLSKLDTKTNIRAIEYLLRLTSHDGAMLHNLNVTFNTQGKDLKYFERLEKSMRSLSQLSSLTLVIDEDIPEILHSCARIVESVGRIHPRLDVQVEFKANPLPTLGSRISYLGPRASTVRPCLSDK